MRVRTGYETSASDWRSTLVVNTHIENRASAVAIANKFLKEMMVKELKISINTLNMGISNLKKKGILIPVRGAKGLYIVDPELFARGKWEDIKNLRLVIEYNKDGSKSLKSNAREQLKQLSLFD